MVDVSEGFVPESVSEPTYPQFTNLALGQGTFDQLMSSVAHHLDSQYKLNRITGPQYADVYANSIQAAMGAATQYLMGILFADQQRDKLEAETSLTLKQQEKIDAEVALVELEKDKFTYEIKHLLPLKVKELEATVANLEKQGELIDAQVLKITAEIAHMAAQESLWSKQEDKITAEIANLVKQGELIDQQILKMQAEVALMNAKVVTERANTEEGVADKSSLIGKQLSLLTAQKYAFAGDIKTKVAKMEADYFNVVMTVKELDSDVNLNAGVKDYTRLAIATANVIEGV